MYHNTRPPFRHDPVLQPTQAEHDQHWQAFLTRWKLGTAIPIGVGQFPRVVAPILALFPSTPTVHHHWRYECGVELQSRPLVWVVVLDELGYPLGLIS